MWIRETWGRRSVSVVCPGGPAGRADHKKRWSAPRGRTRREFLWEAGGGFAGLALIDLLSREAHAATANPLAPKPPHFPAKAKHAVFLFMIGAPSHIDTFDPKPALTKLNGTPYKGNLVVGSNNRPIGYLMQSPFEFQHHGQS